MSVATVNTVVTRFLTTNIPEVLALKGAWGVGKTRFWDDLIRKNKDKCSLQKYAYVSLFGVSSITELRTSIFAKAVAVKRMGEKLDAKTLNNEWLSLSAEALKKAGGLFSKLKDLPYAKNVTVGVEQLASHLISETIICLDDLERLDTKRITLDEVLGLISELKEEKKCKVLLIFNEDELGSKETYARYREKVVDMEVLFAPTAKEAVALGLPDDIPHRDLVAKCTVSLDIRNIRVLQKIAGLAKLIKTAVRDLHEGVVEQSLMTMVLFAWCYYETNENKPTLDFISNWNFAGLAFGTRKEQVEHPKYAAWTTILREYDWVHMDDLDQTILKVIKCGYIEETGLIEEAVKQDARLRASALEQSFTNAWKLFHDSFEDNQAEMVERMRQSFKDSVRQISPSNLSGTTVLMRELGQDAIADELIDYYLEHRADEPNLFDLHNYPFMDHVRDSEVVRKFDEKFRASHAAIPLADAVQHVRTHSGWSREHIDALRAATEDDFYQLFKREHGDNLSSTVKACLQFEGWDEHKTIGQTARNALLRIGKESRLNAIRVQRYGVITEPSGDNEASSQTDEE